MEQPVCCLPNCIPLFALIDGKVKFERLGKDRKMCSVYAEQ